MVINRGYLKKITKIRPPRFNIKAKTGINFYLMVQNVWAAPLS